MHIVEGHESIHQSLDPDADGGMMEVWPMCFGDGVVDVDHAVEVVSDGYDSLNGNLRLVLLTQCFKQLSHPNATVVYRGNAILLTVRMYFVVFINWVSKPMRNLDIKGNFCNSELK